VLGILQDHFDYGVAYSVAAAASVLALVLFIASGPVAQMAIRPLRAAAPGAAIATA
jgi:hypothetical protein